MRKNTIFIGKPPTKEHLREHDTDGKIMLEHILMKEDV